MTNEIEAAKMPTFPISNARTKPARSLNHSDLGRLLMIETAIGTYVGELYSLHIFRQTETIMLTLERNGVKADLRLEPDHLINFPA